MQLIIHQPLADMTHDLDDLLKTGGMDIRLENGPLPPDYQGLVLRCDDTGLALYNSAAPDTTPTRVDFNDSRLKYRLQTTRRSEGLPKAVGLDRYRSGLSVVDATAGLGTDAFVLAALGCRVLMLEQSPVMAALLRSGLTRGRSGADDVVRQALARLDLRQVNAHDYLTGLLASADRPEVVYLDPMFPARQKSAKVKKDIALLQRLLPVNDDVDALLEKARAVAGKRVVLKRPGKAAKQPNPRPDFQVPGKACHFQVFLTG